MRSVSQRSRGFKQAFELHVDECSCVSVSRQRADTLESKPCIVLPTSAPSDSFGFNRMINVGATVLLTMLNFPSRPGRGKHSAKMSCLTQPVTSLKEVGHAPMCSFYHGFATKHYARYKLQQIYLNPLYAALMARIMPARWKLCSK